MTLYRFADVEVDPSAFQARKAGMPVPLEPKAFEVLLFLVRSEGRLVTKAELQDAVWPGTFVTESALTRLIAQLRRGLGDDAREARYIETVPTRGYRFIGRLAEGLGPTPPATPRGPRRRRAWAALGVAGVPALVLGFVALSRRSPPSPSAPSAAGGRLLVSTASGFNAYPAFSPDGGTLAFCSDRTGALEIWVRSLSPGARELQVTNDGQNNLQPAWSPDGQLLAFTSMRRGGIWVVPALGGVSRQLTTFGSRPTWSPDGRFVAFLSPDIVQVDIEGSSTSSIWLVPAAGGEARALTRRWDPPGGHRSVSFSPDGGRIAFMAGSRVWLLDLRSGARTAVGVLSPERGSGLATLGAAGAVAWSKDGRSLVGVGKQAHEVVLWRHDFDRQSTDIDPPLLVAEPTQTLDHLALAPDGGRMAFALVSTHTDLFGLSLGPKGAPSSEPVPLLPSLSSRKSNPLFDRDGRRLSFALWRPGEGSILYTAASDGSGAAPVGTRSGLGAANWSPEGRLVLVSKESPESGLLLELDPATSRQRTLREVPPAAWMRLSPDGREIAFMCGGEPVFAICVASVEGGEPRRVLAPQSGAGWPVWSPDGRELAVELFDGEGTYVAVVSKAGGAPRRVTRGQGHSWPHSWTPDGRRIVFAGQRQGIWNVYDVEVETGRERRLTSYDRALVTVRSPAGSPAGDRLVFERGEVTAGVWVAPLRWR